MRNDICLFRKQDECLDGKDKSDKSLSCENVKNPAMECEDVQQMHSLQIWSKGHELTSNKTYVYPNTLHLFYL